MEVFEIINDISEELKLQLTLLGIKEFDIDYTEIDWQRFIVESSNNRILYFCAQELMDKKALVPTKTIAVFQYVVEKGNQYIEKSKESLRYLNSTFNGTDIPFLIAKTKRQIEYVSFDVDVLFHENQYERAVKIMQENGGQSIKCDAKLQSDIIFDNMARLDIHKGFHWHKSTFIDNEFVWKNPIKTEVFGVNSYIPNLESEAILIMLNLIYERHYIPLLDFNYLLQIKNELNWIQIFETATKYGWNYAFIALMEKFNIASNCLFKTNFINLELFGKKNKRLINKRLSIPFIFTYYDGLELFSERLIKNKHVPFFEIGYFLFAKTRFHLTKGKKVPIYGHWINLDLLSDINE